MNVALGGARTAESAGNTAYLGRFVKALQSNKLPNWY
jgi:hypothetical protein